MNKEEYMKEKCSVITFMILQHQFQYINLKMLKLNSHSRFGAQSKQRFGM